jgi:dihydroorotate dehydrogenase
MLYQSLIRPLLFRFTDPETIHHRVIASLGAVSRRPLAYRALARHFAVSDPRLRTALGHMTLPNPVGLAAGFDKYIEAPLAYPMLGFGYAELGSVTFAEHMGNPRPRLWRLPADKGLIVYYGLANHGAKKTAVPLAALRKHPIPYGVSIAPSVGIPIEHMAEDYVKALRILAPLADYVTLNVSCPNVASCDMVSQLSFIEALTARVRMAMDADSIVKDLFLKIGPHHSDDERAAIVRACIAQGFTGIIATNLVKNRTGIRSKSDADALNHPGGISGGLLREMCDENIRTLYRHAGGKLHIIGVGGIFTAEDAYRKITLGASAVQLITGFIYGGPSAIRRINLGLLALLKRDGFATIADAVGTKA